MNTTLHRTAYNRAKMARAGAFAQLAGGGGATFRGRAWDAPAPSGVGLPERVKREPKSGRKRPRAVFAAFSTTGTTGGSPVARHFEEGLRTSDSGLRKSSVVRSPMSFATP